MSNIVIEERDRRIEYDYKVDVYLRVIEEDDGEETVKKLEPEGDSDITVDVVEGVVVARVDGSKKQVTLD